MAPLSVLANRQGSTQTQRGSREQQAHELADLLPDLVIEARNIAVSLAHGIHGRRRAGPGETFWQFRHYEQSDAASQIDWRRTASSDGIFVREREWEAAHTMWLWPDLSASMNFKSHLSHTRKSDRAVTLLLALSEILVRSGERVALIGLTRPTAHRQAAMRLAEELQFHETEPILSHGLPPTTNLPRFSGAVLFSDFLDPIDEIAERLAALAGDGVTGHLVQILDPAEETLPYDGRVEFFGSEGNDQWIADRTESIRDAFQKKFEAHRDALRETAHRLGWSLLVHHTDRPATEPLLALAMRLQTGFSARADAIRQSPDQSSQSPRGGAATERTETTTAQTATEQTATTTTTASRGEEVK